MDVPVVRVGDLSASEKNRLAMLEGIGVKTSLSEIDGEWDFAQAYHNILSDVRMRTRKAP